MMDRFTEQESSRTTRGDIPRPGRAIVFSCCLSALGLGVIIALLIWQLPITHAPRPASAASPEAPIITIWRVLAVLGLVAVFAQVCRALAIRLGQPGVVGEILAGLAFGPSMLGTLAPGLSSALLPPTVVQHLTLIGTISLTMYMFAVGWEFDLDHMRANSIVLVPASLAMVVIPLAVGALVAYPFMSELAVDGVPTLAYLLFIGTALSVTAFPVLARIVEDTGLQATRVGRIAMLCAASSDVLAWCALAVALALARSTSPADTVVSLGATALLVVATVGLLRPGLAWLAKRFPAVRPRLSVTMAGIAALVFSLAAATDLIGVHAIFGAFLSGLVLPRDPIHTGNVPKQLDHVNRSLFLPVYFVVVGLQVDLNVLGRNGLLVTACAVMLIVAVLTKFCAAASIGSAMGLSRREAGGLGLLMNTRGVTEIVVLGAGLSSRIITAVGFTVMVVMALVTTVITVPGLRLLGMVRAPVVEVDLRSRDRSEDQPLADQPAAR